MTKFYKVSEERLLELMTAANEMSALECVGVDNWDGYSEVDWEECEAQPEYIHEFELTEDSISE